MKVLYGNVSIAPPIEKRLRTGIVEDGSREVLRPAVVLSAHRAVVLPTLLTSVNHEDILSYLARQSDLASIGTWFFGLDIWYYP